MFGFGENKLKKDVWYQVDDQIRIKYGGGGKIKISYRDNVMTMDIPNYVYSLYFEQVLLPRIEALKSVPKGKEESNFETLSTEDLEALLEIYSKKEEFEICSRIKKEIDARK